LPLPQPAPDPPRRLFLRVRPPPATPRRQSVSATKRRRLRRCLQSVTGLAEATRDKIGWIREGAGDRFDDIELSVTVFMSAIVDNREEFAGMVAQGFGLTAEQGLSIPHFLVGTEEQIIEDLQQRREEYGFSYVVISGGAEETMAPIVAKLAGT